MPNNNNDTTTINYIIYNLQTIVMFTSHTVIIPKEQIITNSTIVKISSEHCKIGCA